MELVQNLEDLRVKTHKPTVSEIGNPGSDGACLLAVVRYFRNKTAGVEQAESAGSSVVSDIWGMLRVFCRNGNPNGQQFLFEAREPDGGEHKS